MRPLNIVFAGTPEISATVLDGLINYSPHQVSAVFTQPDKRAGRGKKYVYSPVKNLALQHQIPVYQPASFKKEPESIDLLKQHQPDVLVVLAYGLLLPESILSIPKYGCINIHVSLLPKYRGAAPIQRAILNGETQTGISIMQIDTGLDTGDLLLNKPLTIGPDETSQQLHDKMAQQATPLLLEALEGFVSGNLKLYQQQGKPTYAHKISKSESAINWQEAAEAIHNKVRAFVPWPAATTTIDQQQIKVLNTSVVNRNTDHEAGTVLSVDKSGLHIQTGNNIIKINILQFPGKKPMDIATILNGKDLTKLINTKLS